MKIGNILKLDNQKEYVISGITNLNGLTYLYLVTTNMDEVKVCYLDNDEVVELSDPNEIEGVLEVIAHNYLNEINNK